MPDQATPAPADTQALGLDIDSIEDLDAGDYELLHPITQAPTGAFITLAGPEHPKRKKIALDIMRRARAAALRSGKASPSDPEDDIRESIRQLASVTLGWRGIRKNGADVPFTEAAAIDLYADPKRQWVVKQLLAAMNQQDLFIKA